MVALDASARIPHPVALVLQQVDQPILSTVPILHEVSLIDERLRERRCEYECVVRPMVIQAQVVDALPALVNHRRLCAGAVRFSVAAGVPIWMSRQREYETLVSMEGITVYVCTQPSNAPQ